MNEHPVMPGAEPLYLSGGATGVLLCHGYTGTPQSMRYVGEQLAELGGHTISIPRLPGHGTHLEDMARSTARQWLSEVRRALHELADQCEQVFVMGLSMGGTLALNLAATHEEMVRGVIAINAPLALDNPLLAEVALAEDAPEFVDKIGADIKRPDTDELSYDGTPMATSIQLYALMAATRELLPRLRCPLLALYSREDHVVPPTNGDYLLGQVASVDKRLLMLEDSYHVATLDNDRDRVVRETLAFLKQPTTG